MTFVAKKNLRYTTRNSLLYKSKVEYGDWCINHIENCSHGCKFPCYAMNMAKRFGRIKNYEDWLKPILVKNSLEILDKEIPKYKKDIEFVHMCFMTDPFMYGYQEIAEMSLNIIQKLNSNGIRTTILTKGVYPKKLAKDNPANKNEYGITLVSWNNQFHKKFEPNSAPYKKRLESLKKLHEAGLKTWISMEPYPTPNLDSNQNLDKLLERVKFVDKIVFGKLNYNVKSSAFEDRKEFYEECAEKVVKFCKKNKIEYHIKYGTHKNDNRTTAKIFKTNKTRVVQTKLKFATT